MSDYRRLTERSGNGIAIKDTSTNDNKSIWNAIDRLAELEDKIENGTLHELPCKVGDKVWWVNQYSPRPRIEEYEVSTITIGKDNKIYIGVEYGYFTFKVDELYFTKDQAEARLKELQEKEQ